MPSHTGQLLDSDVYADESGSPVEKRNQAAIAEGVVKSAYDEDLKGSRSFQSKVSTAGTLQGLLRVGFVLAFLHERIWFKPETIDAGFIVDKQEHTVSVWNAFQSASKQITDITGQNTAGTEISHDSIPITIPPNGENQQTIKVLKLGPPTQNTTYDYTIAGSHYIATVTGQRIIPFPYAADWGARIVVVLTLKTAISKNKRFVEQRRPLIPKGLRKERFNLKLEKLEMQKALNTLSSGTGRLFGIPIHSEPIHPTSTITGQAIVNTKEDITYYWHLQNLTKYMILVDDESDEAAIKEISSLSANQVTFKTIVQETMNYERTTMYPIFLGIPGAIKPKSQTDQFITISMEFKETNIGQ